MNDNKTIKGIFYKDFPKSFIPNILNELYRDKVYFPYLEDSGRTDMVIVDLGANVGLFTHYAYPFASKIYSVEPSKFHTETLKKMVEFNNMADKVVVIEKGVALKTGEIELQKTAFNDTMFTIMPLPTQDAIVEKEKVQVVDIETLFKENNIEHVDFLKMDIEGAECEVIGSPAFANIAHKIDSMVIEWHEWSFINPRQVVNTLRDLGFEVKIIPNDATLLGAKRIC